jgi:hypothetical protein
MIVILFEMLVTFVPMQPSGVLKFKPMAQRRMISKSIINSAKFLKMPSETQALYFHLCLHADDD